MDQKKQTIPEMSVDARLLIAKLSRVAVGELITYETLSREIKRDVQKQAYSALHTARNNLKRDELALFEPVRGIGLKRLSASEIANGTGEKYTKKANRVARRGLKDLRCAFNGEDLTKEDMTHLNTGLSVLGILAECTKPKTQKLIASRVTEKSAELAIGETLSLMK